MGPSMKSEELVRYREKNIIFPIIIIIWFNSLFIGYFPMKSELNPIRYLHFNLDEIHKIIRWPDTIMKLYHCDRGQGHGQRPDSRGKIDRRLFSWKTWISRGTATFFRTRRERKLQFNRIVEQLVSIVVPILFANISTRSSIVYWRHLILKWVDERLGKDERIKELMIVEILTNKIETRE